MKNDTVDPTADLLQRACRGDERALDQVFEQHRGRLGRMVRLRLSPRLQGRIDPSDVLQEAYLDVWNGLEAYVRDPKMPLFLWLRLITIRKLLAMQRLHLGAMKRDAAREISISHMPYPEATSESLAAQLLGNFTTPTQAVVRAELQMRLQEVLNGMDPMDREVLALRHFEQLSNAETAQVLGIEESAASNRYVRALERIRRILRSTPGFE